MKYNMILFVLEIFDYIQIKTLFFLFLILPKKKKTHTYTHILFFIIFFSPALTFTCYQSPKFKIKQTIHHTNKITY
jgi:hypothetical protein